MNIGQEIKISDLLELTSKRAGYPFFFRGENKKYEHRTPSIYRNYDENDDKPFLRYNFIGEKIYDELILPRLRYHFGFSFYKENVIGAPPIIGDIRPGATRFYLQIISLLQHYGLPTPFIDVTLDPYIALFYACYSEKDKSFIEDGYGYIYNWDPFEFNPQSNDFTGIDLTESSQLFLKEGISRESRPFIQKAATIYCGHWGLPLQKESLSHLLNALNEKCAIWVVDRSKVDFLMFRNFDPYPKEPLRDIISDYICNYSQLNC